jgi:ParB family chromosome partitioning protein
VVGNIIELEIEAIEINRFNGNFNEESLKELATSIKELGLYNPLPLGN